jgi:Fur family ferric uptake transcriptional regulator
MPVDAVEAAVSALRQRGARVTAPRRALLEALAAAPAHPSADDLVRKLAEVDADVHRATVYRTLEFLVRAGVVAHVHLPHGATAYHLIGDDHRSHAHLVCRGCGQLVDVPELLDDLATSLRERIGFELDVDHVALTGWCRRCSQ